MQPDHYFAGHANMSVLNPKPKPGLTGREQAKNGVAQQRWAAKILIPGQRRVLPRQNLRKNFGATVMEKTRQKLEAVARRISDNTSTLPLIVPCDLETLGGNRMGWQTPLATHSAP